MAAAARLTGLILAAYPAMLVAQHAVQTEPRLATKEEYLACLRVERAVGRKQSALQKQEEEHRALATRFQSADGSLSAQVQRHAPRTKSEIDSYNRAVQKRNDAMRDFNLRGEALRKRQRELNAEILEMNAKCGSLMLTPEVQEAAESEFRQDEPKP